MPLHYAVKEKAFSFCQFLSARGADIYAKDHDGSTPWGIALRDKNLYALFGMLEGQTWEQAQNFRLLFHLAMEGNKEKFLIYDLISAYPHHMIGRDTKGKTPLHYLLDDDDVFFIKMAMISLKTPLVEGKVRFDIEDMSGETPWHMLIKKKSYF